MITKIIQNKDQSEFGSKITTKDPEILKWKNKSLSEMIETIKSTIYPEIEKYIVKTVRVIKHLLQIDPLACENNDVKFISNVYEKEKEKLENQNREDVFIFYFYFYYFFFIFILFFFIFILKKVGNRIKDLEYLLEMKRLEDNLLEKQLHIVPVSGLCYGRIVRKENELKTVIEIWRYKMENK